MHVHHTLPHPPFCVSSLFPRIPAYARERPSVEMTQSLATQVTRRVGQILGSSLWPQGLCQTGEEAKSDFFSYPNGPCIKEYVSLLPETVRKIGTYQIRPNQHPQVLRLQKHTVCKLQITHYAAFEWHVPPSPQSCLSCHNNKAISSLARLEPLFLIYILFLSCTYSSDCEIATIRSHYHIP